MSGRDEILARELGWMREFTPATQAAAAAVPSLRGERLLVVCHLDVKMVPYFEALVGAGAEVWACAANPATTRDAVAEHLRALGVHAPARAFDPPEAHAAHLRAAAGAGPTLLSEMGADATVATGGRLESVRGGLEATGTGIERLSGIDLAYPVFDWDEVEIKGGLHNRHLVGLMAANTFLNVTGLSLYGKTVLVVGYGPVGRRRRSPELRRRSRGLRYRPGGPPRSRPPRLRAAARAVPLEALAHCKSGTFLANLGHTSGELPVAGLREHVVAAPRPHVERCELEGRTLYLLAGGEMFNLAAGPGDPYDTFDLVTALMIEATAFLATEGVEYPPGVHLLPEKVQDRAVRRYRD